MSKQKYDSTVARIAGNILSGQGEFPNLTDAELVCVAHAVVRIARAIVTETIRTEPKEEV